LWQKLNSFKQKIVGNPVLMTACSCRKMNVRHGLLCRRMNVRRASPWRKINVRHVSPCRKMYVRLASPYRKMYLWHVSRAMSEKICSTLPPCRTITYRWQTSCRQWISDESAMSAQWISDKSAISAMNFWQMSYISDWSIMQETWNRKTTL